MKLFQTNNIEIVRACQFFGFELPSALLPTRVKKNWKTLFLINLCSLYNLSPVYCILLIFS